MPRRTTQSFVYLVRQILLVVDDTMVTGDDAKAVVALKSYLPQHSRTRMLGHHAIFLAQWSPDQRRGDCSVTKEKYALDIIRFMDLNSKLLLNSGGLLNDPSYR